ncbi:MAG: hypothetical protein A3I78_00830 [Gammaproteobacteria bacterium RIFCSPLOWO2_02_FULL_56_15]|nr:MAG: hypothetical protein A3I78_00830 [Gammaproteobacteria bacterium RIFCSPLOWO2_02_FULL_56_15]
MTSGTNPGGHKAGSRQDAKFAENAETRRVSTLFVPTRSRQDAKTAKMILVQVIFLAFSAALRENIPAA